MNQAFKLYQLQKIDSQLDILESRLNELSKLLAEDGVLSEAERNHVKQQKELELSRQKLRDCENAVQSQRIKIETNSSALYGGKINNPKELRELQADVESLKKYLLTLEDCQLEAMFEIDQAETNYQVALARLQQVQTENTLQKAGLISEKVQLNRLKEKLIVERGVSAGSIFQENIDLYLRLRKSKRGVAVASIEDGSCTACGATLPPAERQAARSPQIIVNCSSCGRILYAG
jgi:predicted  nucleic acid-binding Zn-ribbon protein